MTSLPVIEEYHSGDLTLSCPMRVKLKHEGKWSPETPTAMFRGLFAGKVLEILHRDHNPSTWHLDATMATCMAEAAKHVTAEVERDGRMLTDAVVKNIEKISSDITKVVLNYAARFAAKFLNCKLIGTELPVRLTLTSGGKQFKFASHIDLLFDDPKGELGERPDTRHWDFKFIEKMPVYDYLIRNRQQMLYQLALKYGHVKIGDEWKKLNIWADTSLIHLPSLLSYARKTQDTNPTTGEVVTYKKGDPRPQSRIIRRCHFKEERAMDMAQGLLEIPKMMNDGHFPAFPDQIGCLLCESKDWCPRYDMEADLIVGQKEQTDE